jgi:hypothetical protein
MVARNSGAGQPSPGRPRLVDEELADQLLGSMTARAHGATASFLKELIRRSVLESLHDDPALTTVTGAHLARALDDLLDTAQAVTRTLLGVGVDPKDLPVGGALMPGPGRAWLAYGHRAVTRYSG